MTGQWTDIVQRDLQNPLGANIILGRKEELKGIYSYYDAVSESSGLLALTSKRLVLSPGTQTVRFGQVIEIPLSEVGGVTTSELILQGKRCPTLGISYSRKYLLVLGNTQYSSDSLPSIARAIQELARLERTRSEEIKIVNVNIDFSDLQKYIDQGGLIIREVKCPACGAPLKLPEKGSSTTCKFCGATVVAEDVFAKIKELID